VRFHLRDGGTVRTFDIEEGEFRRYYGRMCYAPLVILMWDLLAGEWTYRMLRVSMN